MYSTLIQTKNEAGSLNNTKIFKDQGQNVKSSELFRVLS